MCALARPYGLVQSFKRITHRFAHICELLWKSCVSPESYPMKRLPVNIKSFRWPSCLRFHSLFVGAHAYDVLTHIASSNIGSSHTRIETRWVHTHAMYIRGSPIHGYFSTSTNSNLYPSCPCNSRPIPSHSNVSSQHFQIKPSTQTRMFHGCF